MKTIFSITLFVFAIMLAGCNEEPSRKACENSVLATVRDLTGIEGCGFVFELADGQRLEPYGLIFFYCPTEPCPKSPLTKEMMENPLYNFEFVDGKTVKISFDEMPDVASTCASGRIVKITCIEEFPIPVCIQDLITEIKDEPVRNPPASVWQYLYEGKKVYYIPQFCCDFPSILKDSSCITLCSPDGGLTGSGDGRCSNFFTERKEEVLIWKDTR